MSTVGGSHEYRGGYHDTCGGCHDACGDIMSTVCGVQYRGGYHEYRRGYHDAYRRGYHEYRGVMIPLKWRNSSRILSTSHFMIAILVSTFEIQ